MPRRNTKAELVPPIRSRRAIDAMLNPQAALFIARHQRCRLNEPGSVAALHRGEEAADNRFRRASPSDRADVPYVAPALRREEREADQSREARSAVRVW